MADTQKSRLLAEAQSLREKAVWARRLSRGVFDARDFATIERYAADLEQRAQVLDGQVRRLLPAI